MRKLLLNNTIISTIYCLCTNHVGVTKYCANKLLY